MVGAVSVYGAVFADCIKAAGIGAHGETADAVLALF